MKKYFVIAVMALVAVFAVSCNNNKKIDLVGHAWQYQGSIDTMDMHIDVTLTLDFDDAEYVSIATTIVSSVYNETTNSRNAYSWDGEKYLVIYKTNNDSSVTSRNLTYDKKTEEFTMMLDQNESEDTEQMIALIGTDRFVFKKVK